jgi:hypothetical protein
MKTRTLLVASAIMLALFVSACASTEPADTSDQAALGSTDASAKSSKSKKKEAVAKKEPEMTSGQENALEAGQNYIDMTAFSKKGLIAQLSSSAGDGFSTADATFAAKHVDVDWRKEAVEAAKNYLDMTSFSKTGLIEQLSSSAGDKFTAAQARYAVSKVY